MSNLGRSITAAAKKGLAKQIGKSVSNAIARHVDSSDPKALKAAEECVTKKALEALGGTRSAGPSKKTTAADPLITGISGPRQKNREFKVKIGGIGKIARDAIKGADIGDAIKRNGRIDVRYTVRF